MKSCENCEYMANIYVEGVNNDVSKYYVCNHKEDLLHGMRLKPKTNCMFWKNLKVERKEKLDKINGNI